MKLSSNPLSTFGRLFYGLVLLFVVSCSKPDVNTSLHITDYPNRTEDFSLWQLDSFFEEVQMGYIIRTDDQKLIVIDGGGKRTAPILESYLKQLGGKVDTWILTHPHADHVDSFLDILERGSIEIERILHVSLSNTWVQKNEPQNYETVARYNQLMEAFGPIAVSVNVGNQFNLAKGVQMEVFGALNQAITRNAINNSSMAFKLSSPSKSIFFLGDLGSEGGQQILKTYDKNELRADYVQMAHHGQAGVDIEFYRAVSSDYALWPTPKWLWNNQLEGKSVNSGNFKTLIVRAWMDELGIKQNYVSGLEGNLQID